MRCAVLLWLLFCTVLCLVLFPSLKDVCGVISTIIVYSPADNLSKIIIVLLDYIAHSNKHKHLVKTASEINHLLLCKWCLPVLSNPAQHKLLLFYGLYFWSPFWYYFCLCLLLENEEKFLLKNLQNTRNIDTIKRFCDIGETLYKSCGKVLTLRKINSLCAQHRTALRVLRHASKSLILHFAAAALPVPVPVQLILNSLYLQA